MFATPPESGLRVTWLGHSTTLVEIDGHRVLTDPMWSDRFGPVSWAGPTRWYPPLLALGDMPHIDAVVISHDHYDHLDEGTITAMRGWDTVFIVPLGVGAHLEYWGVPKERIVERDWWDKTTVRGLEIVTTPARHASGRGVLDKDATLWAGYALLGPKNRVYFSGDTGLFSGMKDIGQRLGPFDLTMIEVGQYHRAWPDWHIGPEQAVKAHGWLRGKIMLPVHWALVALAYHTWTEPAERVTTEGGKLGARLVLPKPGQSFEPASAPTIERWWPALPHETAEQHPIVSGGLLSP
jgi:L-ascorbate metabolism protein UlaG (beta-lactamase superfamily)